MLKESAATDAPAARRLRLDMVKARSSITNAKKSAKADILLAGNVIDWYHNKGVEQLEQAEARLEDIEKAAERAETARRLELKNKRMDELKAVSVDGQFFPLGEMPDEAYAQLLASSKLAHETKLAAAAKAESDRIEAERVAEIARLKKIEDDRIERERIQAENARLEKEAAAAREAARIAEEARQKEIAEAERLAKIEREKAAAALAAAEESARVERERVAKEKAEAEKIAAEKLAAQEAQAKKEREAIEAKAKAEREAAAEVARVEREKREALELAERNRVAAEQKRQKEEADAQARAAAAPDKEKIKAFTALLETLELPELSTVAGKKAGKEIAGEIFALIAFARARSESL